jgi:hypothetical protein
MTLNSCSVTLTVVPAGVGVRVGTACGALKHCKPRGRLLEKGHFGSGPLFGCSDAKQNELMRVRQRNGASQFPVCPDCDKHTVFPGEIGQWNPTALVTV